MPYGSPYSSSYNSSSYRGNTNTPAGGSGYPPPVSNTTSRYGQPPPPVTSTYGGAGYNNNNNSTYGSNSRYGQPNNTYGSPGGAYGGYNAPNNYGQNNLPPPYKDLVKQPASADIFKTVTITTMKHPDSVDVNPSNGAWTDSISALAWYDTGGNMNATEWLAVSSWDHTVQLYDVSEGNRNTYNQRAQAPAQMTYNHDAPALCCTWSPNPHGEPNAFSGACDGSVVSCVVSNQGPRVQELGRHDEPVKAIFHDGTSSVVTGSFDGTVRRWDIRTSKMVDSFSLGRQGAPPSRVRAGAGLRTRTTNYFTVATSDQFLYMFDLRNPGVRNNLFFDTNETASKDSTVFAFPITSLTMYDENQAYDLKLNSRIRRGLGCIIAGVEGRVASQCLVQADRAEGNFHFKAHQLNSTKRRGNGKDIKTYAFPINCVAFNPMYDTFATGGGDHRMELWDRGMRERISTSKIFGIENMNLAGPVTAMAYNNAGTRFAYATGYDWSRGAEKHSMSNANASKAFIHKMDPSCEFSSRKPGYR